MVPPLRADTRTRSAAPRPACRPLPAAPRRTPRSPPRLARYAPRGLGARSRLLSPNRPERTVRDDERLDLPRLLIVERGHDGVEETGHDVAISEYDNATSTMDLPVEKFMLPISTIVASQFITARAAARHLVGRGSGVVVLLSGTPSRGTANTSAIGAAFGALESLTRSLAVDLGPHGVRVVCVRTMGMAETRIMQQTYELGGKAMGVPKEKIE